MACLITGALPLHRHLQLPSVASLVDRFCQSWLNHTGITKTAYRDDKGKVRLIVHIEWQGYLYALSSNLYVNKVATSLANQLIYGPAILLTPEETQEDRGINNFIASQ